MKSRQLKCREYANQGPKVIDGLGAFNLLYCSGQKNPKSSRLLLYGSSGLVQRQKVHNSNLTMVIGGVRNDI